MTPSGLTQLVCKLDSTWDLSWQEIPTTGLVGSLESLLATSSKKLELLVLPLLGEVGKELSRVWGQEQTLPGRDG